jgi:hypothetical protein
VGNPFGKTSQKRVGSGGKKLQKFFRDVTA